MSLKDWYAPILPSLPFHLPYPTSLPSGIPPQVGSLINNQARGVICLFVNITLAAIALEKQAAQRVKHLIQFPFNWSSSFAPCWTHPHSSQNPISHPPNPPNPDTFQPQPVSGNSEDNLIPLPIPPLHSPSINKHNPHPLPIPQIPTMREQEPCLERVWRQQTFFWGWRIQGPWPPHSPNP